MKMKETNTLSSLQTQQTANLTNEDYQIIIQALSSISVPVAQAPVILRLIDKIKKIIDNN